MDPSIRRWNFKIRKQFWYKLLPYLFKLLPYLLVNPTVKISLLRGSPLIEEVPLLQVQSCFLLHPFVRHRDFSMYNNCFFENWYQRSRDRDFHLIVQYFDFVKGFTERSTAKKVQDPVLSCFENSRWISREISGFDTICIFCALRFLVISHQFRLVSFYSNFPAVLLGSPSEIQEFSLS